MGVDDDMKVCLIRVPALLIRLLHRPGDRGRSPSGRSRSSWQLLDRGDGAASTSSTPTSRSSRGGRPLSRYCGDRLGSGPRTRAVAVGWGADCGEIVHRSGGIARTDWRSGPDRPPSLCSPGQGRRSGAPTCYPWVAGTPARHNSRGDPGASQAEEDPHGEPMVAMSTARSSIAEVRSPEWAGEQSVAPGDPRCTHEMAVTDSPTARPPSKTRPAVRLLQQFGPRMATRSFAGSIRRAMSPRLNLDPFVGPKWLHRAPDCRRVAVNTAYALPSSLCS